MSTSESDAPLPSAPSPQELKLALKAFRKRLKLTRLDAESKLGVGPMSGGLKSGIVAITPPDQYPRCIWEELVKQGKLKAATHGMYSLVDRRSRQEPHGRTAGEVPLNDILSLQTPAGELPALVEKAPGTAPSLEFRSLAPFIRRPLVRAPRRWLRS